MVERERSIPAEATRRDDRLTFAEIQSADRLQRFGERAVSQVLRQAIQPGKLSSQASYPARPGTQPVLPRGQRRSRSNAGPGRDDRADNAARIRCDRPKERGWRRWQAPHPFATLTKRQTGRCRHRITRRTIRSVHLACCCRPPPSLSAHPTLPKPRVVGGWIPNIGFERRQYRRCETVSHG